MDKWSPKYIGNSARKREAAAEHNARYEQRDAVRPKLTQSPGQKAVKKIDKNVGTIGHVDHGIKRNVGGRLSLFQRFARFASYLQNKLIGR